MTRYLIQFHEEYKDELRYVSKGAVKFVTEKEMFEWLEIAWKREASISVYSAELKLDTSV